MKRTVVLLLAAIMAFPFVGCNTKYTLSAQTPAPSEEAFAALTDAPTSIPTSAPTSVPTAAPEAVDPALIDAAWALAEKLEEVHEQQFDREAAEVQSSAYSATVCFPSVTYPDEVLFIIVEKDGEGGYNADPESVYVGLAEGSADELSHRFDPEAITEKQEEFQNARITVTADEIRSSGCSSEIGSSEYKAAAAAIYGEKLAEYYRASLDEGSPFCCYDVRFVGTEEDVVFPGGYIVLIGFRVRDILPFSYLFGYGPIFESGVLYPDYEGWLVGWTVVAVELEEDGSFASDAVLNSAG